MIRFFSIIALSFLCLYSVYGQLSPNLKIGSYKNFNDLIDNSPQHECNFQVLQRSEFDMKMVGGNDFKVISDSGKIKKSEITSKTFAVFDGRNLYLNGKYINGYKHYCLVENDQGYLICKAGIPNLSKRKKFEYDNSMARTNYMPIGGTVGYDWYSISNGKIILHCCL